MPLYVADYLADTTHLSTEAHGAYLLLLMVLWKSGGELQNDDKILARIVRLSPAKWERIKDDVLEFFDVVENKIFHNRVTQEIQKAKNLGEVRSVVGKLGVEAKRLKSLEAHQAIGSDLLKQTPQQTPSKLQPSYTSDSIEEERKQDTTYLVKEKRGCRLPDDFEPDETCRRLFSELNLDTFDWPNALANFKDYWGAVPGAKGLKLDWQGTFRNSLRKFAELKPRSNSNARTYSKPNTIADSSAILEAAIAKRTRELDALIASTEEVGNDVGSIPRLRESTA
jgi:uncharacterized protein YdaU (DUF1376 family)